MSVDPVHLGCLVPGNDDWPRAQGVMAARTVHSRRCTGALETTLSFSDINPHGLHDRRSCCKFATVLATLSSGIATTPPPARKIGARQGLLARGIRRATP